MKVYLVSEYFYDAQEIYGCFKSREGAETFIYARIREKGRKNMSAKSIQEHFRYYEIKEMELQE